MFWCRVNSVVQEDDDVGLSDSTFRFGTPSLKLCTTNRPATQKNSHPLFSCTPFVNRASVGGTVLSMRDVLDAVQTRGGILE